MGTECKITDCKGPGLGCWKEQQNTLINAMPESPAKDSARKQYDSSTPCPQDRILAEEAKQGYTGSDVPGSSK